MGGGGFAAPLKHFPLSSWAVSRQVPRRKVEVSAENESCFLSVPQPFTRINSCLPVPLPQLWALVHCQCAQDLWYTDR